MENIENTIEFNSSNRRFYFKEDGLKVSESFRKAYIEHKENPKKDYLKLFYGNIKDTFTEASKLCSFLKQNDIFEDFEVKTGQEERKDQIAIDFVQLIGSKIELDNPKTKHFYETPPEILMVL